MPEEEHILPKDAPVPPELRQELIQTFVDGFQDLPAKTKQDMFRKLIGGAIPPSATYYKEKYGLMLIEDVRSMLTDTAQHTMLYKYDDYPQWSRNTLKQYINDGFAYICSNMDPKGEFKTLRSKVEIDSTKPDGIRIRWKCNMANYKLKAHRIKPEDEREEEAQAAEEPKVTDWKVKIWDAMEAMKKKGESVTFDDMNLTDENIKELEEIFESNEVFGAAITPKSLLIRKLK